jgi:hypothetical protein
MGKSHLWHKGEGHIFIAYLSGRRQIKKAIFENALRNALRIETGRETETRKS